MGTHTGPNSSAGDAIKAARLRRYVRAAIRPSFSLFAPKKSLKRIKGKISDLLRPCETGDMAGRAHATEPPHLWLVGVFRLGTLQMRPIGVDFRHVKTASSASQTGAPSAFFPRARCSPGTSVFGETRRTAPNLRQTGPRPP